MSERETSRRKKRKIFCLQLCRVEWNITRNFFQAAMRAIDSRLFTLTTSGTFQRFSTTFGVEFAALVVGGACMRVDGNDIQFLKIVPIHTEKKVAATYISVSPRESLQSSFGASSLVPRTLLRSSRLDSCANNPPAIVSCNHRRRDCGRDVCVGVFV